MPWCPECGGEYREGITTCAKCRVGLQDQPPPRPEEASVVARRVLARSLGRLRRLIVEALSHAAGGWRVLRRHRALLLVPVLFALVRGAERMDAQAAWARASGQTQQPVTVNRVLLSDVVEWVPAQLLNYLLRPTATLAAQHFAAPILWLDYQHTAAAIRMNARQRTRPDDALLLWMHSLLPFGLHVFGLAVSGFVLGGFFGQARRMVDRDTFSWSEFGRDGRRYWLRLFLLLAIFVLLGTGLWTLLDVLELLHPGMSLAGHRFWSGFVSYGSLVAVSIVPFFLALTWCAIVSDDAGLGQALRRSVVTVGRFASVGVCLLLLLTVVRLLLLLPVEAADVLLVMKYSSYHSHLLLFLPATMLRPIVSALVGAWFCLTALHWYRAARAKIEASP